MTPWLRWHPHAGSLRRFLLLWLLGGLWALVLLATLVYAGLGVAQLGRAQDARLRAALAAWPQPPGAGIELRVSTVANELVAGQPALAPFPWAASLPATGEPVLYVSHVGGTLVRAAASLRHAPEGQPMPDPLIVQAAARWRERVPGWRYLLADSPLGAVYAMAAAMSAIVLAGVALALRWLRVADGALREPTGDPATYDGPAELRPAVQRMRELHASQSRWVEEQRRFLADASHQLRTPMAVLRTQLQSAIAGDVLAGEVLPHMLHTVDRAAGLANQLLSLTKVEQLKRSGGLKAVNLRHAARDAVMELAPLVAAKRLDFALDGPELQVPGDDVMLGELLRNLLANAIHHTPPNGRLGMLLRDGTGRIELVVWDEGPGIDDTVRPRLFQPFSAAKGGVGLGLSICRQIAEAMGAGVDLYNRIDHGEVVGVDAVVAWGQGP